LSTSVKKQPQPVSAEDIPGAQTVPTEDVPAATGVKAKCCSLRHKAQAVVTKFAPWTFSTRSEYINL